VTPKPSTPANGDERCPECHNSGTCWKYTSDEEDVIKTYCTCPRGMELEDLDLAKFLSLQQPVQTTL
jgi:hypothetical protein